MKKSFLLIGALLLLAASSSFAQLKVGKIFSDHAVLQRDQPTKIWGWSQSKARITVKVNDVSYTGRADKSGNWMVEIPPFSAGGPYIIKVDDRKSEVVFNDILFGDVWVCSGQSNMEWILQNTDQAATDIAEATDSQIRHFKVPQSYAYESEKDLAGGEWTALSPETAGEITAVGYYFAKELRRTQQVPIGLLNTSWGGSRIEPWMSPEKLGIDPLQLKEELEGQRLEKQQLLLAKIGLLFPDFDASKKAAAEENYTKPDFSLDKWRTMKAPLIWEEQELGAFDGIVWVTKTFELSHEQAQQAGALGLAKIDDDDWTFVNGVEVGKTMNYNAVRKYQVPAEVLRAGTNRVMVKIRDTGGGGGFHGQSADMYFQSGELKIDLAGDWGYNLSEMLDAGPGNMNQIPAVLYNYMIAPILNYGIKGAIWYQGESNGSNEQDAVAYAKLFPDMINDWRARWGQGDFPFYWVQLANFMPATDDANAASNWAILRESQTATLSLPNTHEAVIIDIGEAEDIHPRNKRDVGYRLALGARKGAYGESGILAGSSQPASLRRDGPGLIVKFDNVGSKLDVRDKYGYIHGFAIAGKDGVFQWAQAQMVSGDEVLLISPLVPNPTQVKYGWANNPADLNLYNQAGVPVGPFRKKL